MDLYEAIELAENWLMRIVRDDRYPVAPSAEEYEALKICLEAARDKAGV